MGCTVFANTNGFFHKGSGGSGVAFPDVCLSPPPAPTGPVPVPYPNKLSASDLAKGSKSVKIQGKPTALKNQSNISTSTGDEAGNQGGNVITHKTKGKGYFKFWSFDVKVEGKNVCRHGDPMGQNCASDPPGSIDMSCRVTKTAVKQAKKPKKKCPRKYTKKDRHNTPTTAQKDWANRSGAKCWQCKSPSPMGWAMKNGKKVPAPNPAGKKFIADHQPPCVVIFYAGGCHSAAQQRKKSREKKNVKPHCRGCSPKQGGQLSNYATSVLRPAHGL